MEAEESDAVEETYWVSKRVDEEEFSIIFSFAIWTRGTECRS